MNAPHTPVLLGQVLDCLSPTDDETYIDATFGAGGYSRAILNAARCNVRAFDRDPSAIAAGQSMSEEFDGRLELVLQPFSKLYELCSSGAEKDGEGGRFDGAVFDLGVSSMQLDRPERGFSFQADGPLDMRMFVSDGAKGDEAGLSAAEVVNTFEQDRLADILFHLGDERRSRAIARAIVAQRKHSPITRTSELSDLVARVLGGRRGEARHPATRTFQALRMFVNDELGQLARGLAGAERCLKPGGRLVVVTFHSIEDRLVKRFFGARSGHAPGLSRHVPEPQERGPEPSFRIVNHRPLTSSKGELASNPRARSARLRSASRIDAPAWPLDLEDLLGRVAGLS